jgi:hypothetical protein
MCENRFHPGTQVLEQIEQGTLELEDVGLLFLLRLSSDSRTGVCNCSPPKIAAITAVKEPIIRRALSKLQTLKWIRTFRKEGNRGILPVMVRDFIITDASGKPRKIDIDRTADWKHPVLTELDGDGDLRAGGLQTVAEDATTGPVAQPDPSKDSAEVKADTHNSGAVMAAATETVKTEIASAATDPEEEEELPWG